MKAPSAILVLANLMNSAGELNLESKCRIDTAVIEHLKFPHTPLVVCGWNYREDYPHSIASRMRNYILSTYHSINRNLIIMEDNSRDTVGDAFFTKINFINQKSWDAITVVTSDYHIARTFEIFKFIYGEKIGIKMLSSPTQCLLTKQYFISELASIKTFRETFNGVCSGNDLQIYERLRLAHPFYNGDIYPKISLVKFNDDIKSPKN